MRALIWRWVRVVHHADYAWFLPFIARLPLRLAYALSALRGWINARGGRDWRSVALGFRHIRRQSLLGYELLPLAATPEARQRWCRQRFATEARDEFEAQWMAARRFDELQCQFVPAELASFAQHQQRGLILLTLHFDSFYLGSAFIARATGRVINSMSSAVSQDPRVDPAVTRHFELKYRSLEPYVNGGTVADMEVGLRPFYRMLERSETLIVLGDAPVLPNGAAMTVNFLGAKRLIAGGALRLAERTDSDLGAYICRYLSPGRYEVSLCPIGPAKDPETLVRIYQFFNTHILSQPGLWLAADLLPSMPAVEST
jgi:lauroyl/myristoyl acyltransferase